MSLRRYTVTVKLPAYVHRVHAAVAESRQVSVQQDDAGLLARARRLLRTHGGWTLDMRTRRNRTYAYAARRTGKRVERRYLCAVSQLHDWLVSPSSLAVLHGPDPAPPGAEQAATSRESAEQGGELSGDTRVSPLPDGDVICIERLLEECSASLASRGGQLGNSFPSGLTRPRGCWN